MEDGQVLDFIFKHVYTLSALNVVSSISILLTISCFYLKQLDLHIRSVVHQKELANLISRDLGNIDNIDKL